VRRYGLLVAVAGALALTAAGCGGSSGTTLHVVSDNAAVDVVDLGPHGKSPGDVYAFDGIVRDRDGKQEVGHVYGTQTSISLESDAEVVQTLITYQFGGEDSITIGGIARYPKGDVGLIPGHRYVRPIIGGTGTYGDARGEVETVRRSDGRYDQVFHLNG
jgi:hypothetical protein